MTRTLPYRQTRRQPSRTPLASAGYGGTAFPLRVSPNRKYLVDANGVPFFLLCASEWALPYNISAANMDTYLSTRQSQGFNTVLYIALGGPYDGGVANWATYDGIDMFGTANSGNNADVTTVQESYLQRLDLAVQKATALGFHIMMVPMDADDAAQSSLGPGILTMRNNTTDKMYAMGKMFAQRYQNYRNITWVHGVDFQTYANATDKGLVKAVAQALRDYNPWALQTAELPYSTGSAVNRSTLQADNSWFPLIDLSWVYDHYPSYDAFYLDWASGVSNGPPQLVPSFYGEGNYETATNNSESWTRLLGRHQLWWSLLCGGTGHMYGHAVVWGFASGWASDLSTTYVSDVTRAAAWIQTKPWTLFVPSRSGQTGDNGLLTSGYGTYAAGGLQQSNTYVVSVLASDSRTAYLYIPDASSVSPVIALSKLAGSSVTVRTYDPTNGTYATYGSSPYANSGTLTISGLSANSAGDHDYIICLES